jgi:hypothetical protein
MSQPTSNEVQAVDPVLTNMLVGYKQEAARFVANRVFPIVPVEKRGFTYYIFTKKYWFIDSLKARAAGSASKARPATRSCGAWSTPSQTKHAPTTRHRWHLNRPVCSGLLSSP